MFVFKLTIPLRGTLDLFLLVAATISFPATKAIVAVEGNAAWDDVEGTTLSRLKKKFKKESQ